MKINSRYFNLFIFIVALIGLMWIAWSTTQYKNTQMERYQRYISEYDSLHIAPLPLILEDDSLRIGDYSGQFVMLHFWSVWSEKSQRMLNEIESVTAADSMYLIKAMVKEDLRNFEREEGSETDIYVDGTDLYNRIRTPGLPSYLLFDPEGNIISIGVGYSEGAIADTLKKYLK
jgi:hypothetical protein